MRERCAEGLVPCRNVTGMNCLPSTPPWMGAGIGTPCVSLHGCPHVLSHHTRSLSPFLALTWVLVAGAPA